MNPYPPYWRRCAATAIDVAIVACLVWGVTKLHQREMGTESSRWLFILSLLVYESLLTWFACTPGQAIMTIRVRNSDDLGRVSLSQAIGRTLLKYLVGVLQFLSRRRGNHDVLSATLVIDAALLPSDNEQD